MAKENKTQYAILGMLSIEPMTGYDIRKTMANSTQYFWKESNGQLYPSLARLKQENCIESETARQGDKQKMVYHLTKTGEQRLQAWLHREVDYLPLRNELLLKVFFGDNVDAPVSIDHLQKHICRCEENLSVYKDIERVLTKAVEEKRRPIYFLLTVKAGITTNQAEIEWCRESINLIKQYKN